MTSYRTATTVRPAGSAGRGAQSTAPGSGPLHPPGAATLRGLRTPAVPEVLPLDRAPVVETAASSRILNAWYGEARNFEADRVLADRVAALVPGLPAAARTARRYRRVILRTAFAAGIAQVLDLGAGIPTGGGDQLPGAVAGREVRVAYVDNDPVTVAALQQVARQPQPWVVAVAADLATPDALLDLLIQRGVYDPAAPALVVLSLTMHHLAEFQALHLLDVLHRRLAPGSRLMVTTFVADPLTAEVRDALTNLYTAMPPLVLRTATQTSALLAEAGWPSTPRTGRSRSGLFTALLRQPLTSDPAA